MTDADTPTDPKADTPADDAPPEDDEIDRRRLIRWIAVLAFGVPVVVEVLTFGNIINDELLGGGDDPTPTAAATETDRPDAVGVDDELLPETAATETITTSEVRQTEGGRTYVFGAEVENTTEEPVELRTQRLRLRDGERVDGVSSTGSIDPGESGVVTAAWSIPDSAMPGAVEVTAVRGGETVFEGFVLVEQPVVVG
ncbi:hypothetical protein [Halolamina sediminis]|uniref:hypothetical protein n=1 Tax=Halolamina sediminis TaxID=1480675 RepID=UPI0006B58AAA|nr:hypothetical protein [Halolamina sediminis]